MDEPPQASPIATLITFAVFIIAIAGGIVLVLASQPEPVQITINPPEPTLTPAPSATPGPISIYVTGAVAQPQTTHTLPHGSRAADAIDAAGGPTDDADLDSVNLAAILRDGDQIHVPAAGSEMVTLATPSGGTAIVAVNRATVEELTTLPGIGPTLAQRIIDHRETIGPFASLDDLDAVSGIGPAVLEDIAEFVSFE